jgi:hypothetical protein
VSDFTDRHWIHMHEGRITGCHCGEQVGPEDHYGDTIVAHIYDLGFLDGLNTHQEHP